MDATFSKSCLPQPFPTLILIDPPLKTDLGSGGREENCSGTLNQLAEWRRA